MPSPAYTEQNGYYTNLEGKLQKAFKASYPTGEAKEEWIIFNELSEILKNKKLFKNRDNLINSLKNYLKLNSKLEKQNITNNNFENEKIVVDDLDYYYSNVIARASKTMRECREAMLDIKKTGTEG